MAENAETKIIIGCLGGLMRTIAKLKSPAAVQQEILKYVRPLNTSLKKLYGFAPPPLRLDKLEANASSVDSLNSYVEKYFSHWPDVFTAEVDKKFNVGSQNFNGAAAAAAFLNDALMPIIMLLQKLKCVDVTYIADLDLNSDALNFINNNNNLKGLFANLINLAKKLQQSKRSDKKTKQAFDSGLSNAVGALYDFIKKVIDEFNAIIVSVSASENLKTLANDRKKGSALYYLKETKKTGNESKTPPPITIQAFIKFLKALAKEFRKNTDLKSKIKTLQTTLKNIKI
jgi:hypothetical protein